MNSFYTTEKNVNMLIFLMKAHGIRKVIASPGTTNVTFVASVQQDPYFEVYSAADERVGSYMACGMAAESGEPVAISCTGATASRNYLSALTEAYYRKLPILAVTSSQHFGRVGQMNPQSIDRSVIQNDVAVMSVHIPLIHTMEDEWDCNVKLNSALLALRHRGGGPVHINLVTNYTRDFSLQELPNYRVIKRITNIDKYPEIIKGKVGIFVGSHQVWTDDLVSSVDEFCEKYNAVVFCDHTSNYIGKYGVQYNLIAGQNYNFESKSMDLLIDMGEISGAYMWLNPDKVWRVNSDGKVKDTWKKLEYIFDMDELDFFTKYSKVDKNKNTSYYQQCKEEYEYVYSNIPELPYSNIWIAKNTVDKLPKDCVLHLGILNSLRSWNFFNIDKSIDCYCNTGGFGIDGLVSTVVGAALTNTNKLHFLVVGDLAFFYDMNSLANKNVKNNIRIMLINNGCGTEFKNYNHFAAQFGEEADELIAAKGHYGNKSPELVKHYVTDLGFKYICASDKETYLANINTFLSEEINDGPMMFEIFTNDYDESEALWLINNIIKDIPSTKDNIKALGRSVLGDKGVQTIKKIMKRK